MAANFAKLPELPAGAAIEALTGCSASSGLA